MGSIGATTFITNVRVNLSEPIDSSQNEVATAGNEWIQSELLENLNKAKDHLWEIVKKVREDYFITIGATLSLTASAKSYAFAAGFRHLTAIKITTSGYEHLRFQALGQGTNEWKTRDAAPNDSSQDLDLFYYDIVGSSKLLLCNFPPAALTAEYNYIGVLADFTLSASSTIEIDDELRYFLESE